MIIKGIQKTTLVDYPGKIACTIFLFGCNFRCGFCHNPELVLPSSLPRISEQDILSFLEKRKGQLDGVCFTGGEPLLTLKPEFVQKIKSMGYAIKIDTNGSYPERLQQLISANLVDYAAMDMKDIPQRYGELVKANVDIEKLKKSISLISSLKEYEFRTTVLPGYHTVDDIKAMRDFLVTSAGKQKLHSYYLQGFIPQKGKMLGLEFDNSPSTKEDILTQMKEAVKDSFDVVGVRV